MLYKWLIEDKSNLSELLFRLFLKMSIILNDYNYNIYEKNGEQLLEELINLVESERWYQGQNYYFHAYPSASIVVPNPRNYCFIIYPKNPIRQVRNAYLDFHKIPSSWDDLEDVVNDIEFPEFWQEFLEEQIGSKRFTDRYIIACVLLCFEIARRASFEEDYPLTREMIQDAIDEVMEAPMETYGDQVR